MAWSGAWLECLGEVSEDEADAVVGEEQVGGELGARGPLLLLLLVTPVVVTLGRRRRRRRGGWRPGLGGRVGRGGGEAGGVGVGGWVGGGGSGGAVTGPMARAAALEAAGGRRRSHGQEWKWRWGLGGILRKKGGPKGREMESLLFWVGFGGS